jgi:putative phosphoribosyl transferase
VRVLNEDVVRAIPYASEAIEAVTAKETAELERREQIYREGRPPPELRDKIVLLVDDGVATGATMRAAVKALQQRSAAKIVVAVPVGPPDTCEELAQEADEGICLSTPSFFQAVGQYYEDFSQTSDDDVRELLTRAAQEISEDKSGNQQ